MEHHLVTRIETIYLKIRAHPLPKNEKKRLCLSSLLTGHDGCNGDNYGLETVVSVLFSNTRMRLLYNEWEMKRSGMQY